MKIKIRMNERLKVLLGRATADAPVEAPSGKRTVSIKARGKLSVARERARAMRALACGIECDV